MSSDLGQPEKLTPKHIRPKDLPKPQADWHFTKLSGKLSGLISISTAATCAPFCRSRYLNAVDDDICSKCYATAALSTYRESMVAALERNRQRLSATWYSPPEKWPVAIALRLLSHGDISSPRECANLWHLVSDAPYPHIAMWTKNIDAIARCVVRKPKRLQLIYSSPKIDICASKPSALFDRVFTVYRDTVPEDTYACPGNCASCLVCYSDNDIVNVGIILHR